MAEGEDEPAIVVEPGLAIDRWGREIVVEKETGPIAIPPHLLNEDAAAGGGESAGRSARRATGSTTRTGRASTCSSATTSASPSRRRSSPATAATSSPASRASSASATRSTCRAGCLRIRHPKLSIPDVISGGRLDYEALVKAVSEPCPCPDDPCIPLANLFLDFDSKTGRCHCRREVDLAVRPIVYTNDLLLQLILAAVVEAPSYEREK